jgi:DNA-binding transcriptional regulator of glucitol operon
MLSSCRETYVSYVSNEEEDTYVSYVSYEEEDTCVRDVVFMQREAVFIRNVCHTHAHAHAHARAHKPTHVIYHTWQRVGVLREWEC